jgi:hypothetical protein
MDGAFGSRVAVGETMGVKVGLSVGGGIGVGVASGVLVGGNVEVAGTTGGTITAGVGVGCLGPKISQVRKPPIPSIRRTAIMIRKISNPDNRRLGFFLGATASALFGVKAGGGGAEALPGF